MGKSEFLQSYRTSFVNFLTCECEYNYMIIYFRPKRWLSIYCFFLSYFRPLRPTVVCTLYTVQYSQILNWPRTVFVLYCTLHPRRRILRRSNWPQTMRGTLIFHHWSVVTMPLYQLSLQQHILKWIFRFHLLKNMINLLLYIAFL